MVKTYVLLVDGVDRHDDNVSALELWTVELIVWLLCLADGLGWKQNLLNSRWDWDIYKNFKTDATFQGGDGFSCLKLRATTAHGMVDGTRSPHPTQPQRSQTGQSLGW